MKGWSIFLVIQFFVLLVNAVYFDTAFSRDWVSYGFHFIHSQQTSPDVIFGLTENNLAYNVRVSDAKVNYLIDLNLYDADSFQVAGPYVVTYSSTNSKAAFHRASNGIYIDTFEFASPVTLVKNSSMGIFILQNGNELSLWSEKKIHALGHLPINELSISESEGNLYVKSGETVLKLNDKLQLIPVKSNSIKLPEPEQQMHASQIPDSFVSTRRAILVPKPDSIAKIEKAHHLESDQHSKSLLFRYIIRCKNHLVELGQFATSFTRSVPKELSTTQDDEYHVGSLLVFYDHVLSTLVAKDTKDGLIVWTLLCPLNGDRIYYIQIDSELAVLDEKNLLIVNLRDGTIVSTETFSKPIDKIFQLGNSEKPCVGVRSGSSFKTFFCEKQSEDVQYLLEETKHHLQGYRYSKETLVPTWRFSYENDSERLVAVSNIGHKLLNAVGIARFDQSILYKFLHPNLVAILTKHEEDLYVSLLDGVSGNLYMEECVTSGNVLLSSVNLVQNDNWVVISYVVKGDSGNEQRVTVYDLFTDSKIADSDFISTFESLHFNVTVKTFIYPERISSMAVTNTKFGITTKSIIAFTTSGNLIEIPKFILNSRRIDNRKMTQDDFMDDFRMIPYEPLIKKDPLKVLNHRVKLFSDGVDQILVQPTELESTTVVCLVNSINEFCTLVQPSLSYDILPASFQKVNLLLTIGALFVAYVVSKPFVYSKKLNNKWFD